MAVLAWAGVVVFWASWVVLGTFPAWSLPLTRAYYRASAAEHRLLWSSRPRGAPPVVRAAAAGCFLLAYAGLVVEPVVWTVALGAPVGVYAALLGVGAAACWRALGEGLLRGATSARLAAPAWALASALGRTAGAALLRGASPPEGVALLPLPWSALYAAYTAVLPALAWPFGCVLVACAAVIARERFDEEVRAGAAERERARLARAARWPALLVGAPLTAYGLGVHYDWQARAFELVWGTY